MQWRNLGMGDLEIDSIPPNVVTVIDSRRERDPKLSSVLCHMDEGVLEGILIERYGLDVTATEGVLQPGKNIVYLNIEK